MSDLVLRVNGADYGGWKNAQVTRGIESVAFGFSLAVSDRWSGQSLSWPIHEEDACEIRIGDEPVISGFVDRRSPSFSAEDHGFSVEGRSKAGALVDCSADLSVWQFTNVQLLDLAHKLCDPLGISVFQQAGLTLPRLDRVVVDPGEKAFDALDRACKLAGVLAVSDGDGALTITRAGTTRTRTALEEGKNIKAGSATFDAVDRFAFYRVLGQHAGTANLNTYGLGSSAIKGEAQDETVVRTERLLIMRADGNCTSAQAKVRAQWEAKVRAARAQSASVTVVGWTQDDGSLWPINAIVHIKSKILEMDADMLIVSATYSLGDDGSTTQLSLKRPDAFAPEPVVKKPTGTWAELRLGA